MYGLLGQTITIFRQVSKDKYARESWDGGTDYRARVELKERRRLLPNGNILVTAGKVFLRPDVSVDTNDKIEYNSVQYRVFDKSEKIDGSGSVHHISLEVTKWQSA